MEVDGGAQESVVPGAIPPFHGERSFRSWESPSLGARGGRRVAGRCFFAAAAEAARRQRGDVRGVSPVAAAVASEALHAGKRGFVTSRRRDIASSILPRFCGRSGMLFALTLRVRRVGVFFFRRLYFEGRKYCMSLLHADEN